MNSAKKSESYMTALEILPIDYKIWASLSLTQRKLNNHFQANKFLLIAEELYNFSKKFLKEIKDKHFKD